MHRLIFILALCSAFSLSGQQIAVERVPASQGVRVSDIRSVFSDSRGILWVGTYGDGVLIMKDGRFVNPAGANRFTGPYVTDVCEGPDGEVVVVSERGTSVFNGRSWSSATESTLTCIRHRHDILLDSLEADLGTILYARTDGLFSSGLLDSVPRRISDTDGLLDDTIQTLAFDRQDVLWVGTRNNGLLKRSVARDLVCIDQSDPVRRVKIDPATDLLWIDLGGGTLAHLNHANDTMEILQAPSLIRDFVPFTTSGVLLNDTRDKLIVLSGDTGTAPVEVADAIVASAMAVDAFGIASIVDQEGNVSRVEKQEGGVRLFQTYARIPVEGLIAIFPTGANEFLIVYDRYIGVLEGKRFREVASIPGTVSCSVKDESGTLWLGTVDGSILQYTGGIIKEVSGIDIGMSRALHFIRKVPGGVVVADDISLYKVGLDLRELSIENVRVITDFPERENNSLEFWHGEFWFGSGRRLCHTDISGGMAESPGPALYLQDVLLPSGSITETDFGNEIRAFMKHEGHVRIPHRQNDLVFSWESVSTVPGDVGYAYRLENDQPWQSIENRNQIQLVSLSPGGYAFDVRACDGRMNCTTLPAPWLFEIGQPWWRKWWIWMVGVVALTILIVLVVKSREKRIREEAQREIELAKARTTALELEQKARQLQMRPHFISNALNAIQSKLINGDAETASDDLVRFSRMMRSMLNSSRKSTISLEEDIELLREYVEVVGLAKGQTPSLDIVSDEGVDMDDIEIPPMLIQPVIENAIEHGGPEIVMHISMNDQMLTIEVKDNGPGFERGFMEKQSSVAMKLLKERLGAIGGNVRMFNGDDGGAVVILEMPV